MIGAQVTMQLQSFDVVNDGPTLSQGTTERKVEACGVGIVIKDWEGEIMACKLSIQFQVGVDACIEELCNTLINPYYA